MSTLVLQHLLGLLYLAFGVLALLVARQFRELQPVHREAWMVTGVIFTVNAVNAMVSHIFATTAYVLGPSHSIYRIYVEYAPAANHSRTFLMFGLFGFLVLLALKGRIGHPRIVLPVVCTTLLLGGVAVGLMEGEFVVARHYTIISILDTVALIALAGALMISLLRDSMDRLLWFALAVYGFRAVLQSLFIAAMAWAHVAGSWTPHINGLWIIQVASFAFMVALAYRRLVLAKRRTDVPGLLSPLRVRGAFR